MLLMDESFKDDLLKVQSERNFLPAWTGQRKPNSRKKSRGKPPEAGYRILAVTACPTGIAHTYMAAESLEKTAAQMGYSIKSGGQMDPEEIKCPYI